MRRGYLAHAGPLPTAAPPLPRILKTLAASTCAAPTVSIWNSETVALSVASVHGGELGWP